MNLKMNRLLNNILLISTRNQSLRTLPVILKRLPPSTRDLHRCSRLQPVFCRLAHGREVVSAPWIADICWVVVDGEGVDVELEVDDEAAEGGEGGCDEAEVHHCSVGFQG